MSCWSYAQKRMPEIIGYSRSCLCWHATCQCSCCWCCSITATSRFPHSLRQPSHQTFYNCTQSNAVPHCWHLRCCRMSIRRSPCAAALASPPGTRTSSHLPPLRTLSAACRTTRGNNKTAEACFSVLPKVNKRILRAACGGTHSCMVSAQLLASWQESRLLGA
jgi:hypothetical protein